MHFKYLNKNLRTFVKFLDQLIYALFRPAHPWLERTIVPRPVIFCGELDIEVFRLSLIWQLLGLKSIGCMKNWSSRKTFRAFEKLFGLFKMAFGVAAKTSRMKQQN